MNTLILGMSSWQDGRFELIVRNPETYEETVLHGKLEEGQFEQVDKLLPSCVMIKVNALPPASKTAGQVWELEAAVGGTWIKCGKKVLARFGSATWITVRNEVRKLLAAHNAALPPSEET